MPRSRGSEMPQRQSPRGQPHPLRTSSSDSDTQHHRPITERSPKLGERRSPRAPQADSVNQKKLGTRIAHLESQLGQAQEELKMLKEQLVSAEAAKKEAQQELENKKKKKKKQLVGSEREEIREKHPPTEIEDSKKENSNASDEVSEGSMKETDVFEVPVEKKTDDPMVEANGLIDQAEKEKDPVDLSAEPCIISEPEKPSLDEIALKDDEIKTLKTNLQEKEKELEVFVNENENLKNQLNEMTLIVSSAKAKEAETSSRLCQMEKELEASKANVAMLNEKLEAAERAKDALETEMKTMRVQTEQWRKAADAAAAVLSGGMEMNGKIPERCGSMDKHFGGAFETPLGGYTYTGFAGSPGMADDLEDGFGSGKRKGTSGIKMFGDLWKRKGSK